MSYRAANRKDRWKAIAAVAAVHVVLGAVIVTGLNVEIVGRAIERLETFDISLPKPPPEEPPPPLEPNRAKLEEGAAGRKAEPSPIVAPEPRIEVPTRQEVVAAPVAGTGTASSAGAAASGTGTGAGGSGAGRGGGGAGDGAGMTPARLVRNLSRSDYRRLTGGRMPAGQAGLAIRVNRSGVVDSCRVEHSSGDSVIDAGLCPLISARLRFDPARDAQGRPIPYFTNYMARWRR